MDRELNINRIKLLNKKKLTCVAVPSHSTDSGQVVIHTVSQLPTSTELKISHLVKKISHEKNSHRKLCDGLAYFWGSVITLINLCVLTFHQR